MPTPSDPSRNGHDHAAEDHDQPDAHHDAPTLSPIVPGRPGRPSYSLDALRERVERQFQDETADRADILLELDTEERRRDLLREITEYVLAVEAITLSAQDRRALIDAAYRHLFTFGPLDDYLHDDAVTEITVNGPHAIHVRRWMGALEPVGAVFDDRFALAGTLERILAGAGAVLSDDDPFLEVGVVLAGRAARISLVAPPISPDYSLEIRLHPRQPVRLKDLHGDLGMMPPQAAALLAAILDAGHGLLIVGDVGLGKTTLAGALLANLVETSPDSAPAITVVERAAEMALPPAITRRVPVPPTPDDAGQDFAATIQAALDETPAWLAVDEIRGDESAAVWAALTHEDAPRYLWVFRGDPQPDRLRSAFGMVIRKQHPAVEQAAIHRALARHLPFVVALARVDGLPRLRAIAEWTPAPADDVPSADAPLALRPLLTADGGTWSFTGALPRHDLGLSRDFWT